MRSVIAVLIAICSGFSATAHAESLALPDALALVYSSNPQIQAARARVRAADETVAEARGGLRPNVSISGNWGFQRQDMVANGSAQSLHSVPLNAQATIDQPVFTGGEASAEISKSIALVRAARADLVTAEQNAFFAAIAAYLDVVRDQTTLAVYRDDVDVLRRQREATKTELDLGDATRTDLDQVDVRLDGARSRLALAEAQLSRSRSGFERIVGRPAETLDSAPPFAAVPSSYDQALQFALHQNPQIQSAMASERAAEFGVDAAFGAMLPHADIVAQYSVGRQVVSAGLQTPMKKLENMALFGQITIPLYQGGVGDAKVREAKETRFQAHEAVIDAERAARQLLDDSWNSLEASKAALKLDEHRVAASKQALSGVVEQQHQGERSILDILNAEQERLDAELALASSRHDAVLTSYQLMAASGRLTASALGLKVQLYDPEKHFSDDADRWLGFGD